MVGERQRTDVRVAPQSNLAVRQLGAGLGGLTARTLDVLHARMANRIRLFPGGWGDPAVFERAGTWFDEPASVDIEWQGHKGTFLSPYAPWLPLEAKTAHVELLLPRGWTASTPVAVHFPSTGDAHCVLARRSAEVMLRHGIGSVLLEVAFYGARRPFAQHSTYLRHVSDLWLMGMAAWEEGRAILGWLRDHGFTRLGACGISMGGLLASHLATHWPTPLAVASLASPHDAGTVYSRSVVSQMVDWKGLGGPDPRQRMVDVFHKTDIRTFPRPVRPDACLRLAGAHDLYVPPASAQQLADFWPGSTLRWLPVGHVQAVAWKGHLLSGLLAEAFGRL